MVPNRPSDVAYLQAYTRTPMNIELHYDMPWKVERGGHLGSLVTRLTLPFMFPRTRCSLTVKVNRATYVVVDVKSAFN